WHGLTPMLALSAVVVALGVLLAWRWDPFHRALNHMPFMRRVDANRAYQRVVDSVLSAARWFTRQLQSGDFRRYTLITSMVLILIVAWSIARSRELTELALGGELLPLP